MTDSGTQKVVVIGGGAAGFFAAINIKKNAPGCEVVILEKNNKLLSKVRISGGGRCNVTHNCFNNSELIKNYPRGEKELRQVFARFSVKDTIEWFRKEGVLLKTENDGRMFPVTDSSQTIIDLFLELAKKLNIRVQLQTEVFAVSKTENNFQLKTSQGLLQCNKVICSSGGFPKAGAYDFIKNTGHSIVEPLPSLFTFNLPDEEIKKELQGVAVPEARISIAGSKLRYAGPVLITHWGLSGPAVLKLSAFAAELFFRSGYEAQIIVNWLNKDQEEISSMLEQVQQEKKNSLPRNTPLPGMPARLWEFLCTEAELIEGRSWAETGKKQVHKLMNLLYASNYKMKGKSTFKEEFVTCGGVNLKEVDFRTMESKMVPGLFFCGEVLNIDAITGGFNFQAAWSTAFVCAGSVCK